MTQMSTTIVKEGVGEEEVWFALYIWYNLYEYLVSKC
jgi:hypothetical protein